MKIQAVKGTRDFYPPIMAVRNYIIDGWKTVSRRCGFEEYDGPIFEYLKMYQIKSGQEIAEQLFSLTDRGQRELAIRPEITPTLARMVNAQINSLPRPIKWFSVPRLCRAERPQKGRLREFFQWNIDIIGVDEVIADAEIIFTTIDYLRQTGLVPDDIVARINSRKMLAGLLEGIGIEAGELDGLYAMLDKKAKLPAETFDAMLAEKLADVAKRTKVAEMLKAESLDGIENSFVLNEKAAAGLAELKELFGILEVMGIADFCRFDIGIVRGLAYYTGMVFEVYDRASQLRAVCGGGRYDNLLRDFGGTAVTATGMGMGDCVLEILLREKGLLKEEPPTRNLDFFVAYADRQFFTRVLEISAKLRKTGFACDFSIREQSLGRQIKQASGANAKKCIIIGQEFTEQKQLAVKDMKTGSQRLVDAEEFLSNPSA